MAQPNPACSSFPSLRLTAGPDAQPIEIHLIAQLAPGNGDRLIRETAARQRAHADYRDALDEPSVRLAGMHLAQGDRSSLYSFVVGEHGHPFHRHAGARMFTAISGSSGVLLRFCGATDTEVATDPRAFVRALQQVSLPPDSLFSVRFGGGTWHQFLPLDAGNRHAALFALSCHTDELGGRLSPAQRSQVLADSADIPSLTECVPAAVQTLLDAGARAAAEFRLSLDSAPPSWVQRARSALRRGMDLCCARVADLRARLARRLRPLARLHARRDPIAQPTSLLHTALDGAADAMDSVYMDLEPARLHMATPSATALLAQLLEGFMERPPLGVGLLMDLRNRLVRPLGLRTSRLGCPVSSLLSEPSPQRYCGRFPVLDQRTEGPARAAEVLLGADDKHLRFRASVSVEVRGDQSVRFRLSTRVQTRNAFGRIYLALIRHAHEAYIAPALLQHAVDHVLRLNSTAHSGLISAG